MVCWGVCLTYAWRKATNSRWRVIGIYMDVEDLLLYLNEAIREAHYRSVTLQYAVNFPLFVREVARLCGTTPDLSSFPR